MVILNLYAQETYRFYYFPLIVSKNLFQIFLKKTTTKIFSLTHFFIDFILFKQKIYLNINKINLFIY